MRADRAAGVSLSDVLRACASTQPETAKRLQLVAGSLIVRAPLSPELATTVEQLLQERNAVMLNAIADEFPADVQVLGDARLAFFRSVLLRVLDLFAADRSPVWHIRAWTRLGHFELSEALGTLLVRACGADSDGLDVLGDILDYTPNAYRLLGGRTDGQMREGTTGGERVLLTAIFQQASASALPLLGHVLSEPFVHLLLVEDEHFAAAGGVQALVARLLSTAAGCRAFGGLWETLRAVVRAEAEAGGGVWTPRVRQLLEKLGEAALLGVFAGEAAADADEESVAGQVAVEVFLLASELELGSVVLDFFVARGRSLAAGGEARDWERWLRGIKDTVELLAGDEIVNEPRLFAILDLLTAIPGGAEAVLGLATDLAESASLVLGRAGSPSETVGKRMLEWLLVTAGTRGSQALYELVSFSEYKEKLGVLIPFVVEKLNATETDGNAVQDYVAALVSIVREDAQLDGRLQELVEAVVQPGRLAGVAAARRVTALCWAVTGRDGRDSSHAAGSLNATGDRLSAVFVRPHAELLVSAIARCPRAQTVRLDRRLCSEDSDAEATCADLFKSLRLLVRTCHGSPTLRSAILQLAVASNHLNGLLLLADLCRFAAEPSVVSHACSLALANPDSPELAHFFALLAEMPADFAHCLPFVLDQLRWRTDKPSVGAILTFLTRQPPGTLPPTLLPLLIHRFVCWPRLMISKLLGLLETLLGASQHVDASAFPYLSPARQTQAAQTLGGLRSGNKLKLFLIALHNLANKLEVNEAALDVYRQNGQGPHSGVVTLD